MWLRDARKRLGFIQSDLQRRLARLGYTVTRPTISNWENNTVPIDDARLRDALAIALGMTEPQILDLAGYQVGYKLRHSEAGEQAANLVDRMPPELQERVVQLLRRLADGERLIMLD